MGWLVCKGIKMDGKYEWANECMIQVTYMRKNIYLLFLHLTMTHHQLGHALQSLKLANLCTLYQLTNLTTSNSTFCPSFSMYMYLFLFYCFVFVFSFFLFFHFVVFYLKDQFVKTYFFFFSQKISQSYPYFHKWTAASFTRNMPIL